MMTATRAGGAIAAVCLLAATACSSDGDDTTSETAPTTEARATTPSTAAPATAPPATTEPEADEPSITTTATESTLTPSSGTVEVPFYVIDANVPGDAACGIRPGFDVTFSDESGGSTVVEARIEHNSITDEVVNATCTRGSYQGLPALFWAAVLEAPAAETYESIELRYPFANGQGLPGRDGNITVFEIVTQAQVEAGIYVEVNGSSSVPLDPSDVEDFPLPD